MHGENSIQPEKKWNKPQLSVIGKGRPEEAVLSNCKRNVNGSGGANSRNNRCRRVDWISCVSCSTYVNT